MVSLKVIHKITNITAGGLFGTTLVAGMALAMPTAKAETATTTATDNVSVSVPLSCTLGGTGMDSHTVSIAGGQVRSGIGTTTITAYCNDSQGFEIYAAGYSNDELGNTDLVSSLGSNNIATGILTSGSTSSWGMRVWTDGGTYAPTIETPATTVTVDGASYYAVPSSYTRVAYRTSGTESEGGTGSEIKTTYYIYAAGTQPSATYTGQVSYAMFHPYSTAANVSLKKAFFLAGKETVEVDGQEYYKMQDMSAEICAAANVKGEASQVQLVDTRDNNIYWVTKLDDDKCWMTQNLDLNLSSSVALTSENTDLNTIGTNGYTTDQGYSQSGGVISWTPTRSTINATGRESLETTFTGWSNDYYTPYSADVGKLYTDGTWYDSDSECDYDGNYNCINHVASTPYGTNGTHGAIGNYYNWSAAVAANTTNVAAWKTSTYSNIANNPENSICPKGWRLPTVSSTSANSEFNTLNTLYNSGDDSNDTGLFNAPLYFARAGYVDGGAQNNAGDGGYYWSSTVYDSNDAYYLFFYSSYVSPENYYGRNYGLPVRCVAR